MLKDIELHQLYMNEEQKQELHAELRQQPAGAAYAVP